MLKISIYLKEEGQEIIGIKEDFAAYCEKFGDVVRVEVETEADYIEAEVVEVSDEKTEHSEINGAEAALFGN